MKTTWATSGTDLILEVTGTRVRAGLESALRDAVSDGRLAAGTRLPSSRSLSADMGVARNTVADAYGQLVAEGWLESRTGSGTWVAERPGPSTAPLRPPVPTTVPSRYDFCPGAPGLSLFPRRAWLQATRRVLGSVPDGAFDYPELRGLLALRVALAGYLSRARHVVVSPGNIVVCAGITHGLSLICQVMKGRGARSVAVEAYGYKDLWDVAEGSGLHLVPVPVDDRGAMVGQCAEADGAILTPGHQFPWGVSLHPSRRRQIVEWATRCSAVVLEDDYDGEFRYDRQPVGALQALAPGHVVYVGTASKSLSPGLRIGWLVVPDGLLDEVLVARKNSGATPATLDQLVLAELITSGFYDRHVRRARLLYRGRRDRLVRALDERAPGIEVKGAAAGLQTLALLRPGQMEADVLRRGDELGVTLHGLSSYTFPGCPGPPALVIGYARPPDHAFGAAVERLCTALA